MEKLRAYLDALWQPINILQSRSPQQEVASARPAQAVARAPDTPEQSFLDISSQDSSDSSVRSVGGCLSEPPVKKSVTYIEPTLLNPGVIPEPVVAHTSVAQEDSPFVACFNHCASNTPLHKGFDEELFLRDKPFPDEVHYRKAMEHIGFTAYRHGQRAALFCINTLRKVLAVMPTGHGKSALFVLPALASSRIAVVIMPTISLQQDQFNQWSRYLSVRVCSSQVGSREGAIRSRDVASLVGPLVLIITPEKLCMDAILQESISVLTRKGSICLFAIDEAHLVLEWVSFRPEFLTAADLLQKWHLQGRSGLLLLTATLTATGCHRLMKCFNFRHKSQIDNQCVSDLQLLHRGNATDHLLVFSAYKSNIFLDVVDTGAASTPADDILKTLQGYMADTSIVYCRRRADNDDLAQILNNFLGKRFADSYHSGKPNLEDIVQSWMRGDTLCICATIAFGMGINKPNVRLVVDANPSASISTILQKVGRCGRDGKPAKAVLYYNCSELQKLLNIVARDHNPVMLAEAVSACLFYLRQDICKWRLILRYFGQEMERDRRLAERCNHCSYCSASVDNTAHTAIELDYQPLILGLLLFVEHNRTHEKDGKTGLTAALNHLAKLFAPKKVTCKSKEAQTPKTKAPVYTKTQIFQTILELVQAGYLNLYMSALQGTLSIRPNPARLATLKAIKHISTI